MKGMKSTVAVLAVSTLISSCSLAGKGAGIGAGAGTAAGAGLGALIGALTGNTTKGLAIGAAVGAVAGTTTGTLIGRKMDKAKAAAAAVANAQVETVQDNNGLDAVKVTFDSGILFAQGQASLKADAMQSLQKFASNVLNVYTDCDVAICGYASSEGSASTNLTLSQSRANAVQNYLTNNCRVSSSQIKSSTGYGADPQYLIRDAQGVENRAASRRVEVYLYASKAMIEAANNGTLK